MSTEVHCPAGECPSVGVEAIDLRRYADVRTGDGELLVYDTDDEDAWIQADVYFDRDAVV